MIIMKRRTSLYKLTLSVVMACFLGFAASCSNDDYLPIDSEDQNLLSDSFIGIENIEVGPKSAFETKQFKEAADRFSKRLMFKKDNTISLMDGTTADNLNISESLFELFNGVVRYWNEHPVNFIGRNNQLLISTDTRGGNILCDVAASEIYSITAVFGWKLTAKLFRMWYFDNRSSEYTLTDQEWTPVAGYSNSVIGQNYQNNPFMIDETTYYQNGVSFYNSSSYDLKFALGNCTVYFDGNGNAVGLSDFYDFNAGDRGTINETLMAIIRWIGDDGGYPISFGVVKP